VKVACTTWEEFLEALKRNPPKDGIIRYTYCLSAEPSGGWCLSLVAGYRATRPVLVEFIEDLGGHPPDLDEETMTAIRARLAVKRQTLEQLGFTVQADAYGLWRLMHTKKREDK